MKVIPESKNSKLIGLEASRLGCRVFRNNRGLFLTLDGKNKVRAGLEADYCADWIGFYPMTITKDMVGKKIAVFTSVEAKKSDWVKPKNDTEKGQQKWAEFVTSNGGIGFMCQSAEKMKEKLKDHLTLFNS